MTNTFQNPIYENMDWVFNRDSLFREINERFSQIFSEVDPNQDYSLQVIHECFARIGKPVPHCVVLAHNVLQERPQWPLERKDKISRMMVLSEQISILFADFDNLIGQLEYVCWPDKKNPEGGKDLTEDDRKMIKNALMAPYRAVRDILLYLFSQCAKVSLSGEQSILNLDRDVLKGSQSE